MAHQGLNAEKVLLIEGGYTSDTRHLKKLAAKQSQYGKLADALNLGKLDLKPMTFAFGTPGLAALYTNSLWKTCAY